MMFLRKKRLNQLPNIQKSTLLGFYDNGLQHTGLDMTTQFLASSQTDEIAKQ